MKYATTALLLFCGVYPVSAQNLADVLVKGDKLSYKGYEVTRAFDSRSSVASATIKKDRRVMARIRQRDGVVGLEPRFGLFPLLGKKTKQLIVERSTGGAHCCFLYTVYDLFPKFRLIFSSEKYPVGDGFDELQPADIDGDGTFELPQRILTFDYFDDMAYVESPSPKVVFQYDRSRRKYVVANRKFAAYILKGTEKQKLLVMKDEFAHLSSVLNVMLHYVYAGRAMQGWAFFESQYSEWDRKELRKLRAEVERMLKRCTVYRSLYAN